MNEHLLVGCPPGTLGVVTDSGWTDSRVFVKWLNHFVEAVKPTPAKIVGQICDLIVGLVVKAPKLAYS